MSGFQKTMLIINPASGKGMIREQLYDILDHLFAQGYLVTPYITQQAEDASRFTRMAGEYDLVICSGGDGTMNEVVNGLMYHGIDVPLAYIPAGTVNDFAHNLGLPMDPIIAVEHITSGQTRKLDVGVFADRYFTYVAAAGAFSEVSYSTSQELKSIFGRFAYYYEGLRKLPDLADDYQLTIQVDDTHLISGRYAFVAVANTFSIGGILQFNDTTVDLSDGCMEMVLIRSPQSPLELQRLVQSLRSRNYDNDLLRCLQGQRFHIKSDKHLSWTVDGEKAGAYNEVSISIAPRPLKLVY